MRRNRKGFTLIELIIVLAIFSIIMTLVMSFIDPVSKIMKKASTRERTAAYVDNIGEYLDNSLHYAKFMRVYYGDFVDPADPTKVIPEGVAVQNLVEEAYNGALKYNSKASKESDKFKPLQGTVRVLKLMNQDDGKLEKGQIYETVYNFAAGDNVKDASGDPHADSYSAQVSIHDPKTEENIPVINAEHFEDYCYYYKTGYYTLNQLKDPENYADPSDATKSFALKNRVYYSSLNPMLYAADADGVADDVVTIRPNEDFCVNVVSYKNDEADNMVVAKYTGGGSDVDVPVFKSPAHMDAVSMYLPNINSFADNPDDPVYVRYKRKANGDKQVTNGKYVFEPVSAKNTTTPFSEYTANTSTKKDIIYIVFIVPDEVRDTNINYN